MKGITRYLLFSLLFAVTLLITCLRTRDAYAEVIPAYSLSVSFDLKENALIGTAEITFPESDEIAVSTGGLLVILAEFNGRPVEYDKKQGVIRAKGKGQRQFGHQVSRFFQAGRECG